MWKLNIVKKQGEILFERDDVVEISAFLTLLTSLTNLNVGLRDKDNFKFVLSFLDLIFVDDSKERHL